MHAGTPYLGWARRFTWSAARAASSSTSVMIVAGDDRRRSDVQGPRRQRLRPQAAAADQRLARALARDGVHPRAWMRGTATAEADRSGPGVEPELPAAQRIEFDAADDDVPPREHRVDIARRRGPGLEREERHRRLRVGAYAEEPVATNPLVGDDLHGAGSEGLHLAGGTVLGPPEVRVLRGDDESEDFAGGLVGHVTRPSWLVAIAPRTSGSEGMVSSR